MKIYSLNPVSIHQQDDKMNYNIPAAVSPGMFHETATKIAEASQDVFENAVNNMVKSEAMYQKKESDEMKLLSQIELMSVNMLKMAMLIFMKLLVALMMIFAMNYLFMIRNCTYIQNVCTLYSAMK